MNLQQKLALAAQLKKKQAMPMPQPGPAPVAKKGLSGGLAAFLAKKKGK